jgi:protein TonB
MRKFLFLVIAFFAFQIVSAQEESTVSVDNTVYNTAGIDVKPDFPGGRDEFYKFVAKNYRTPDVKKLNGKVYVTFVIEKDGSLTDINVIRDIGYGTGKEAIRVLELSTKWLAGEHNGKKVRCTYSLPISIMTTN